MQVIMSILLIILYGCYGNSDDIVDSGVASNIIEEGEAVIDQETAIKIYVRALAGELPVYAKVYGEEYTYLITDLPHEDDIQWNYHVLDYHDVNNDHIKDLIMSGPYNGVYLSIRRKEGNIQVYELARGEGMSGVLQYVEIDGMTYIAHVDNTHYGREYYYMDAYRGETIIDSRLLSAEYGDIGYFDETASCHYGGYSISARRFLELRKELFGY